MSNVKTLSAKEIKAQAKAAKALADKKAKALADKKANEAKKAQLAQAKAKAQESAVVIPKKGAPISSHANGADFSESRPGVLAFFVTQLLKAHGKGGLTKKGLLALACEEFPDRTPEKLKSTIAMQLPSGFYIEKGYALTITQGEQGRCFSLALADKQAGDTWRIAKRTNPNAIKPAKKIVEGGEGDE